MIMTLLHLQMHLQQTANHRILTRLSSTARSQSTLAIARQIPTSFIHALTSHHSPSNAADENSVTLSIARHQHHVYLTELRKHIPTLCLPPLECHPDCVFVEDTVVAVEDTAVICRLGHESRRGEVDTIRDVLCQLGMNVMDMGDDADDDVAYCDGGDVMYTGRHLFVGLSGRTNDKGFQFLRKVFGEKVEVVAVPPVIQGRDVLHLKSAVTHLDEETILAPTGPIGDTLLQAMLTEERGYTSIRLPDILSCNAVTINGHVLAQDACEVSRESIEKACAERGLGLTFVDTSELAKKDAALTCCSVLLSL